MKTLNIIPRKKLSLREGEIVKWKGMEWRVVLLDMHRLTLGVVNDAVMLADFEHLQNYITVEDDGENNEDVTEKTEPCCILDKDINKLDISVRIVNTLRHMADIHFVSQLVKATEYDLIRLPNIAKKSLSEIKEVLSWDNLKLGMTLEEIENFRKKAQLKIINETNTH